MSIAGSVSVPVTLTCVILSYFLGTFPSALLAGGRAGVDPTAAGSRNPGTTNVLRTAGRSAAGLTLLGDAGKGALAAVLGWAIGGHGLGVACGVTAVVGHVAPVTRQFRGGKGVATGAGMLLVLFPGLAAVAAAAFGLAVAVTRTVSVGSLAACTAVPVVAAVVGVPGGELAGLIVGSLLVLLRHSGNIGRLLRGEEGTLRA